MTATPPADGSGNTPTLTVTPDPADVTDRLSVAVSGLDPGQRVTLAATFAADDDDDEPDRTHGGTAAGAADADRDAWRATLEALAALEVTR